MIHKSVNWFVGFYRSALGKKAAMAITGIALFGFVFAHMAGNLKIFLSAEDFNHYAEWLREVGGPAVPHGGLLWLARIGLLAAGVIHVTAALQLTRMNRLARGGAYKKKAVIQAGFAERTMRWSGVLLGLYIVYHIMHFTIGNAHGDFDPTNPYRNVIIGFSAWPVAAVYILANLLLGMHLYHGLWSMFQSLGWNHPRYNSWRRAFAVTFAVVVTAGFVSVPLAVLTGFVS